MTTRFQLIAVRRTTASATTTPTAELTIYVDADACPVKPEVLKVAEHQLRVVLVANSWMHPPRGQRIRVQVVPGSFDAADDWIVEHVAQDGFASVWRGGRTTPIWTQGSVPLPGAA